VRSGLSAHIHGTHVPVEEPSTASKADLSKVCCVVRIGDTWCRKMAASVLVNPPSANTSVPSRTPADLSAHMADGGPGDADTTNSCPTRAAAIGDLRDHSVRLTNRCGCHCLRRCCDG
jgi:hypothetical protein